MWWMTLLVNPAVAAPPQPWVHEWYGRPRLNVRAVSVNGVTSAQALVGAEGGVRYVHAPILGRGKKRKRGPADIVGRTRAQGDVLYGLFSKSLGADLRVGSFIGPTSKYVTYQVGPDVWFNGYGVPDGVDYHLPWSLGVEIPNTFIVHFVPEVDMQLGISPGWAFDKDRQGGGLGPFHEVSMFAALSARVGSFSFVVGYQRLYNAAGTTDGLILSGGL